MPALLNERIVRIEKGILHGERPRAAMYNARMVGPEYAAGHGRAVHDPVVRLTTDGGLWGIGWSRLEREAAEGLVGRRVGELFSLPAGCNDRGRPIDLPLWDLAARAEGLPLYRLLGARGSREVLVYDGSIYIDDVGASDEEAEAIFADEVRVGQAHGFRHFKIKVGRGAYWMPIMEGIQRDALVVRTVRRAAGPGARVLIDANMASTVNTAIALLEACAQEDVYWFEEPFAEDRPANLALKAYLRESGSATLVADGEFHPPIYFWDLVREGLIDVVQQDFRAQGLSWWLATAERIQPWGALCAPHCWGSHVEHYHQAHLAASVPHFAMLESSPVEMPGIVAEGWAMQDGCLIVPETPGAGWDVEEDAWQRAVRGEGGFSLGA